MCFSAAANFVGSGALGTVGVMTLTRVKHRRELLFASLPALFAIHQLIEGFVWLGLDGMLSSQVTHNMGAAFMLYAQGLLPFLLPLSVLLFEPDAKSRRRMLPFLVIGGLTALYILWALTAYSTQIFVKGNSIVYINQATNKYSRCGFLTPKPPHGSFQVGCECNDNSTPTMSSGSPSGRFIQKPRL